MSRFMSPKNPTECFIHKECMNSWMNLYPKGPFYERFMSRSWAVHECSILLFFPRSYSGVTERPNSSGKTKVFRTHCYERFINGSWMLHECSPRKTLGDSHGLRKCFHRTSLNNREGHNDDKMGRKRDDKSRLYRKLFWSRGPSFGEVIVIWRWGSSFLSGGGCSRVPPMHEWFMSGSWVFHM